MANHKSDEETVSSTERVIEVTQENKSPKFLRVPDIRPFISTRTKNFICPACKEPLEEVIAINGEVRGWCGKSQTYVRQLVKEEHPNEEPKG